MENKDTQTIKKKYKNVTYLINYGERTCLV